MKRLLSILPVLLLTCTLVAQQATQQELPFKMEELTSPKFVKAVDLAVLQAPDVTKQPSLLELL